MSVKKWCLHSDFDQKDLVVMLFLLLHPKWKNTRLLVCCFDRNGSLLQLLKTPNKNLDTSEANASKWLKLNGSLFDITLEII